MNLCEEIVLIFIGNRLLRKELSLKKVNISEGTILNVRVIGRIAPSGFWRVQKRARREEDNCLKHISNEVGKMGIFTFLELR